MKKKRSRVWKLLLVVALLPVLLFVFIQTPPGKVLLAKGLSSALSQSENLNVHIGEITGWVPGKVTVGTVEVGDAQGIWISGKNLHSRWLIRDLFDEKMRFKRLTADEIIWHRFPAIGKKETPVKGNRDFQLLELQLEGLSVKTLKLEKSVAGVPLEYAVHSGGISFSVAGELRGELEVSGDAKGLVELDARLTGRETDQLKIVATLEEMLHPTFGLDRLSGRGEAVIKQGGVNAVITSELAFGGQPGRLATRLHYGNRELNLQQLQFSNADFGLAGDISFGFTNRLINVAVNTTFIDESTNKFDLRGNAVVATSNKTWGVDIHALEIGGWDAVSLNLAGQLTPEQADLHGTLSEMDAGRLPMVGNSNFTGRVIGALDISGPMAEPTVHVNLTVEQFTSVEEALDELPELDFSINGGLAAGVLFAETSITNYANGHFRADFRMPCEFSLLPFRYKPMPEKTAARLDANLDLSILNQLAFFQNQLVSGMLHSEVTFEDRKPSGFLRVDNGRYEHYDWGILFRDFNADLMATDEGFKVNHASATDGGEGTLKMTGGMGAYGLGLNLYFSNAWIFQRDEIDAQISGALKVSGHPLHSDVAGELTINRADILLDNLATPPPPVLTGFDRTATNVVVAVEEKAGKAPPMGLDIRVLMPDQIFVNASMIEAVLGGELHIQDSPQGVSVSGTIEPRRGFVNFIGKKFRFTEGEVVLDGSIPTIAILDNLTAEYSRRDVTALLVLNGPANDPRFRLESSPAMPEDEVLSHVLFNRDTSSISPYQAYQIAMAARQLSGGLNGPGFMFQIRQAIGVDTLEWREAEAAGESSSVAAGKYITSGLYVEINQSLDEGGETGMVAELEVSRHFSVETYTGPEMRTGIGVNWRNDY